jgi:hypothetical protein
MKDDIMGKVGAALSVGCAVHCLTFPMIMPFVPFIGKDIFLSHSLEIVLLGLAAIIGLYSLVHGFRKHHRRFSAFPVFFAGLIIIMIGFTLHHDGGMDKAFISYESVLLVIGGLLMGAAQLINMSFHKRTSAC